MQTSFRAGPAAPVGRAATTTRPLKYGVTKATHTLVSYGFITALCSKIEVAKQ